MMFETERADWWFIIPATLVWFSALLVTLWGFVKVQEMTYRLSMVSIVGLVLFLTGIAIRRVAKRTLGKYYSYGLRTLPNHQLIKHGIYKHIRHPCHLAMLMYSMGIPLFFSSLYGFLLMLGLIPCTLYRIRIGENMLIEKFGDEYREYMTETKKLIPFVY